MNNEIQHNRRMIELVMKFVNEQLEIRKQYEKAILEHNPEADYRKVEEALDLMMDLEFHDNLEAFCKINNIEKITDVKVKYAPQHRILSPQDLATTIIWRK